MDSCNNLSYPNKPFLHIIRHPGDETVKVGDDLFLDCVADGSDNAIHYCWYKNNASLPNSDSRSLILENVLISYAGYYRCDVFTADLKLRVSSKVSTVTVLPSVVEDSEDADDVQYAATDKFALLIANEEYSYNPRLISASNDVKALSATLTEELHFKTISLVNLNLYEMNRALQLFCSFLSDGVYCLIYLAGHGFENNGQSFIVPTDAKKSYQASDCFSVKKMLQEILNTCHINLTVVLLDVCRKRNDSVGTLVEPSINKEKLGNFVISFATMESGEAYEVKGQHLGVYVTSLKQHLSKNKRVTRVIELVHSDLHQNFHTKGIQQPVFKSNIYENRKLTDPILPRNLPMHESMTYRWCDVHDSKKPTLFVFDSCSLKVVFDVKKVFTNILLLKAWVLDKGRTEWCKVWLDLRTDGLRCEEPSRAVGAKRNGPYQPPSIMIKNLQRFHYKELPITIKVQYCIADIVYEEEHNDVEPMPFLSWWHSS